MTTTTSTIVFKLEGDAAMAFDREALHGQCVALADQSGVRVTKRRRIFEKDSAAFLYKNFD
jgi:hypothetical protein